MTLSLATTISTHTMGHVLLRLVVFVLVIEKDTYYIILPFLVSNSASYWICFEQC